MFSRTGWSWRGLAATGLNSVCCSRGKLRATPKHPCCATLMCHTVLHCATPVCYTVHATLCLKHCTWLLHCSTLGCASHFMSTPSGAMCIVGTQSWIVHVAQHCESHFAKLKHSVPHCARHSHLLLSSLPHTTPMYNVAQISAPHDHNIKAMWHTLHVELHFTYHVILRSTRQHTMHILSTR